MKFKRRNKITLHSLLMNLSVLVGLLFLIYHTDDFKDRTYSPMKVQALDVNSYMWEEVSSDNFVVIENIYIDDSLDGQIYYIVQSGDNLSKISDIFGVTVSHIKNVNKLINDTIRPGQKLVITEDEGIIYIAKGETVWELAKKYKITSNDIMKVNYMESADYKTETGDEIFIPITEVALAKLFPKAKPRPKPTYTKPSTSTATTNYSTSSTTIAKYRRKPNVSNGFYRGHCTRFVAIKKFPYISDTTQRKLWNGNAKNWYANAAAAGYKVWQTPAVESIVVLQYGWTNYYYYGHVAIVKQIDRTGKRLLVEEMNASGKFVVTKRWIPMNGKVVGYIYL